VLRVPTRALPRIHLHARVELRGRTLRIRGRHTRVLARDVLLAVPPRWFRRPSRTRSGTRTRSRWRWRWRTRSSSRWRGTLKSLSPLVVSANGRDFTCAVPNGVSLAGFATGDFVEMECESVRGIQTLRELELEDEDDVGERAEATTTAARATPATTTAARVATEAVTAVGTTTSPGALP
jgi:hypothetical protein